MLTESLLDKQPRLFMFAEEFMVCCFDWNVVNVLIDLIDYHEKGAEARWKRLWAGSGGGFVRRFEFWGL